MLKRTGFLKRSPIRKVGSLTQKWREFATAKAARDLDDDGLLRCQDYQLGLPRCGYARERPQMDLHHIIGRNERPDLYFTEDNLVWLTRACHEKAHEAHHLGDNSLEEER